MAKHGYESGRLNLPFVGISTFGKNPYQPDWSAIDADFAILGAGGAEGSGLAVNIFDVSALTTGSLTAAAVTVLLLVHGERVLRAIGRGEGHGERARPRHLEVGGAVLYLPLVHSLVPE